ncbi:MAG: hypothetical protein B6I17_03740 [Tenericutes bacterium 4572_104]|nr:MAG: hypothetical protein B6I17_03740 [Tenericutes bacterium 4572_104]
MRNNYVLVVDDEFRIRRLLSDFLKREGYKVIEAADGEEALDIIFESNQKVDLIILDVMMPKYDGWYVLERVRDFLNTPIIMLTARSDEYDQLKGFKLGADDYVTKPFSPGVLMALIKEYELLKFFIDNKGIALSRDKILNAVWNYDYFGDLRTVDTHIKQLRAKLGKYSYYISTVRSVGYRLDSENEIIN